MFNPGDTITHQFRLPFNCNVLQTEAENILVTYRQNGRIVLIKNAVPLPDHEQTDLEGDSTVVEVDLTQQESLSFDNKNDIRIQININYRDGGRISSHELTTHAGIQHYREVM